MRQILNFHSFQRIVVLSAILALSGCVTTQSPQQTSHQLSATELLELSKRATLQTKQLGLAVAAADVAGRHFLAGKDEKSRQEYNAACVRVASLMDRKSLPALLDTPVGKYRLELDQDRAKGIENPAFYNELVPLDKLANKTLVTRPPSPGFGGALVAVHQQPDARAVYYPVGGVSNAATAVVTIQPEMEGGIRKATVTLYDPAVRDSARILGQNRQLAADFTAPIGYYPLLANVGMLGFLRPDLVAKKEGLFLLQPYDPKKIPVLFIHGLTSQPQMWYPVLAAIEAQPELRNKYQLWVYAYPTGNPIGYSAMTLRETLAKVYQTYPRTKDMVIVNHSMGGLLTDGQIIDSDEAMIRRIFKDKAPEILALPNDSLLKRCALFEANPRIKRVIYVAAPHKGAPLAERPLANFAASLVRFPSMIASNVSRAAVASVFAASGKKANFIPNGINTLDPDNPFIVAMAAAPRKSPFHSIIGVAGFLKSPLEKTSDTVVPYWSSHLDGALSEKIVPYPHTDMFGKPEATDEIKRILRLHADLPPE